MVVLVLPLMLVAAAAKIQAIYQLLLLSHKAITTLNF
jgi:hypothetical protein